MSRLVLQSDEGEVIGEYVVSVETLRKTPGRILERIRNDLAVDLTINPDGIRALREARELTQAQLADAVRVRTNTVARWERGERTPRGKARERLAQWMKHWRRPR